jgi:hypothetical protein
VPENEQIYRRFAEILTGNLDLLPEVVDVERYREECVGVTQGWVAYRTILLRDPGDVRRRLPLLV